VNNHNRPLRVATIVCRKKLYSTLIDLFCVREFRKNFLVAGSSDSLKSVM